MAGHHLGIGHAVAAVLRIPTSQHGETLGLFGHPRADLGELHARNRRVDHAELAFNADGRIGLGVERVVMACTALRPDQDAVRVTACLARFGQGFLLGQDHRQRNSQAGQRTDFEEIAPAHAFTITHEIREEAKHGFIPPQNKQNQGGMQVMAGLVIYCRVHEQIKFFCMRYQAWVDSTGKAVERGALTVLA